MSLDCNHFVSPYNVAFNTYFYVQQIRAAHLSEYKSMSNIAQYLDTEQ